MPEAKLKILMNSKAKLYISSKYYKQHRQLGREKIGWFWQLLNPESSINAFFMKKLKKTVFRIIGMYNFV